jgi:replicative DNA helicase
MPIIPVAPINHNIFQNDPKTKKPKLDKDGKPVLRFCGKNPSYLDRAGSWCTLNHSPFQERHPTQEELTRWFENPDTGIGTICGWNGIIGIDMDSRRFASQEACDRAFYKLLEDTPGLRTTWLEQSQGGGYRIFVKPRQYPDFTLFALEANGEHMGEALGKGKFTVLSPTVGPQGGAYNLIHFGEVLELETLETIGIFPARKNKAAAPVTEAPLFAPPVRGAIAQAIRLETLCCPSVQDIMDGRTTGSDRSAALATVIHELHGWLNWTMRNGVYISGTVEAIAEQVGEVMGLDSGRVGRILKTIDGSADHPAAWGKGGDESCWLKVCKLEPGYKTNRGDALSIATRIKSMPAAPTYTEIPVTEGDDHEEALRASIKNYISARDSGNRFKLVLIENAIKKTWAISKATIEDLVKETEKAERQDLRLASDLLLEVFKEVEDRASTITPIGIQTGFDDLDGMTQGLQRSDLIILAARPAMGKTALAMGVAKNIATKLKKPVAVFSMEMSSLQLVYRLLSTESGIEMGRLRAGNVKEDEWLGISNAIESFEGAPLYFDDSPAITLEEIEIKANNLTRQVGELGLIVIDYLQLMGNETGANRVQELSHISRGLKRLARKMNVPIVALSQLSRGVESRQDKRPIMSDLRESGAIEQDGDIVMMLYRDEYYNADTYDRGIAELSLQKHRNGPTGTIKLAFDGKLVKFQGLKGGWG